MCGIIGANATRSVQDILLSGLSQLEYRGYDSAGMVVLDQQHKTLVCRRVVGRVEALASSLRDTPLTGFLGMAHTRWATHGKPTENNAHPHVSHDTIAVVHNGIIENHHVLREKLVKAGYVFSSETDTEVIAHLIHSHFIQHKNTLRALRDSFDELKGAFSLGVMSVTEPHRLFAVRHGSPLVIGIGVHEHFIASDPLALLQVTQKMCYLEEGDIADVYADHVDIYRGDGTRVERDITVIDAVSDVASLGTYRHYMQKEMFEQAGAVRLTLGEALQQPDLLQALFGREKKSVLMNVEHIHIVACGTSYHAGLVARYWLESMAGVSCQVDVASEFRYRKAVVLPNTLFILISQSGETADVLSVLRDSRSANYLARLAICNVAMSALAREADIVLLTKAGREIGVASTKAFTAQLTSLAMLVLALASRTASITQYDTWCNELQCLPSYIERALLLDDTMKRVATHFQKKAHTLFLGRGVQYPIALEGALKLKEISYIHAEAYPAGELKHGPLALVDSHMPVVACAPHNVLFDKLCSNLQEVAARGGQLIVLTDNPRALEGIAPLAVIDMFEVPGWLSPVVYTIPLQLLAYHVAVMKGTDVDKPRNLAKSVTVE